MSAERWFIPGPDGTRKETNNFDEVRQFLRQKAEERKLLIPKKTPPLPVFAAPAHRAPQHMRVSQR